MRIGIDCSLIPGERTGIGQYAYQLVSALSRIDRENEYMLYPVFYYVFHPRYREERFPNAPNMHTAFRRIPAPILWVLRHSRMPWVIRERLLGKVDIVHSTSFFTPRFTDRQKRLLVTIYDLTFLTHPECHTPQNVAHALHGTREAVKRADCLIAISHHTRQELIERMGANPQRVVVTHLAPNPAMKRETDPSELARVREAYALPHEFILFLGSLEPRKNVARLIAAYAQLPRSLRHEVHLVIAGGTGWLNENVHQAVAHYGVAEHVHFVWYIPDSDLSVLYSLATVFAYPSLAEGFGLPVLEAMQCGVPVLTSNVSSLPEVAGDAALLVSPTSEEEITDGLTRLLEDSNLRTELRKRGLGRAEQFSWERCAQETLAVYQQCR